MVNFTSGLLAAKFFSTGTIINKIDIIEQFLQHAKSHDETSAQGIIRACRPILAALAAQKLASPILWITPGIDSAERLHEDLAEMLKEKNPPLLFPEKENENDISRDSERLAILQKLESWNKDQLPPIVITSIHAILQPTVRMEHLQKGKLPIRAGETVNREILAGILAEENYKRVSMVEKRGEFAIKGCIFDIFPITGSPVRLELDGDEVESIRVLSTESQRSGEELPEVVLLPAASQEDSQHDAWLTDYLDATGRAVACLEEPSQLHLAAKEMYQEYSDAESDILWERFNYLIKKFRRIKLTAWSGTDDLAQADFELPFETASALSDRVEELLAVLPQWQKEKKRVIIISRQVQRLRQLFREAGLTGIVTDPGMVLHPGEVLLIEGTQSEGFRLCPSDDNIIEVLTDREIMGQRRQRKAPKQLERVSHLHLEELSPGDLVVHLQHGIGKYLGVETLCLEGVYHDMIRIAYAGNSTLNIPVDRLDLISRYESLSDKPPKLSKLGGHEWTDAKIKLHEEAQKIAEDLLQIYAKREASQGFICPSDTEWQREFEEAFPFEETRDQLKAINEVKQDMENIRPMDRLICGDVGYGKTEVALRAAFKMVTAGRQVAVLAPTTVLAHQHFQTFRERMAAFPIRIHLLSRFRTEKQIKETIAKLSEGEADIVIGTHRLLSKDIKFKNLGLLIIDEEHKFGVMHKERLKELREGVDVLTMSATPIPRTLNMALQGIREMSVITTAPEARLPIKTSLFAYSDEIMKGAISRELNREGQVYVLYNRVQGIEKKAADIRKLLPQARVAVAHGQMEEGRLEQVMMDFYDGAYDVLVCTTIIESGLDIPNVNTIIVMNADRFGLAQLYQLRGRVGRSTRQAYCYLTYPVSKNLSDTALARLETIRDFTQLGSGFQVAKRDLEIRGAGEMLGAEQSGHINSLGFSLYCQMLEEAVQLLKGEAPPAPDKPVVMDIPISACLTDDYVPDDKQRVALYRRIAQIDDYEGIGKMREELRDRFGRLTQEADNLMNFVDIKLRCKDLDIPGLHIDKDVLDFHLGSHITFSPRRIEKLKNLTGWNFAYENGKLYFSELYGRHRQVGERHYPPDEEFLEIISDILKTLQTWRNLPEPQEPEPAAKKTVWRYTGR